MPLPEKKPNEKPNDFIQKCMIDEKMRTEYPDKEQRYAVCREQVKGSN